MYIESNQTIGINDIITDIKPIHATYLIITATVKCEAGIIWSQVNKKGQIHVLDSPSKVWITNRYPKLILTEFHSNPGSRRGQRHPTGKRISQKFSDFRNLSYVGDSAGFMIEILRVIYKSDHRF